MLKNVVTALSILAVLTLLTGCGGKHVGIKEDRPIHKSVASDNTLYEYCAEDVSDKAPKSGFYPLENHMDSLAARLMLAKAAKHRITVQYFTFYADDVGTILTKALVDAADRGVKVDVLIDDIELSDEDGLTAMVNTHPNINIRVFNPTNSRGNLHYAEMGLNTSTVGRRMHNKSFTADNSMAVYGGRNIGDMYFGLNEENFFVDNDMLTVGPLVNEITNEFDIYFSNAYSVDFSYIEKANKDYRATLDAKFEALRKDVGADALHRALKNRKITKTFNAKQLPLYFGDAILLYDMPEKITTDINDTSTHIEGKIPQNVRATKRFYMVSPYFIPSEKMFIRLQSMIDKGVDVAVLTNSLESSDSAAVYAYYSLSQKHLLEMGVRLYEIHPNAFADAVLNQDYNTLHDMPKAMLHAKTIVIDDNFFAIGSVNMDPRSRQLNTELVSIIKSTELNAHEATVFERMTAPENAYELSLEYNDDNSSKIVWKATINGEKVKFYNDGDSSTWLHIKKNMSLWFPVEDLL